MTFLESHQWQVSDRIVPTYVWTFINHVSNVNQAMQMVYKSSWVGKFITSNNKKIKKVFLPLVSSVLAGKFDLDGLIDSLNDLNSWADERKSEEIRRSDNGQGADLPYGLDEFQVRLSNFPFLEGFWTWNANYGFRPENSQFEIESESQNTWLKTVFLRKVIFYW